jgi:ATP-dependent DNA helicase DinG
MAATYVVLDLETTGLDNTKDKIIEVAAVKVNRGLIGDQFATLVAITGKLSEEITALTGITNEMLTGQPRIEDIIPSLAAFIGDAVIVAHNAEFDRGFLTRSWQDSREWLDTVTLAQIVYPCEPSFALAWLTRSLGIENSQAHRALSDALATAELLIRMENELAAQPAYVKSELLALSENDSSPLSELIRKRCGDLRQGGATAAVGDKLSLPPKRAIDENYRLDIGMLEQYLGPNSVHRERLTDFEDRPQQLLLAQAVARTMNDGGCLLAEAGTGTGKSLAYLLPAALFAKGSGRQVAVSTHTRNLQEQLLHKDVPMLEQLLNTEIHAEVLKGRGNYLCNRLYKYFSAEPGNDLRYFLMRVAVWRGTSCSGDSGEMSLNSYSRRLWQRLAASKENCAPFCPYRQSNNCYVQKTRAKAAEADILILNHYLLIANAAHENGFLPELPYLIIDEAQHLEGATEDQLTTAIDFFDILSFAALYKRREKGREVGVIPTIAKSRSNLFELGGAEQIELLIQRLDLQTDAIVAAAERFYGALDGFFHAEMLAEDFLPARLRILPHHRLHSDWPLILQLAEELANELSQLAATSFQILDLSRADLINEDKPSLPRGFEELFSLAAVGRGLSDTIRSCVSDSDDNYVAWVEYSDAEKKPGLCIAPIEISSLLAGLVYEKTEALVMTSATLSVNDDFSYFKRRTGLDLLPEPPAELTLPSPFFYRDQALFTIVDDLPDWSNCPEKKATAAISSCLIRLLSASKGRAIVLFTSHQQLKNVYREINRPLQEQGISVLAHGVSGDPYMLLKRLKNEERCCILGAASFWEGVDVIGEALSLIVVVRLPFWPPNTPLASTRMERLEAEGKSSFNDYSLPMALIRFKQGFGRLIRTDKDCGVFCVLDKRIVEKRYGMSFINALPEMQQVRGDTEAIAAEIKKWLE